MKKERKADQIGTSDKPEAKKFNQILDIVEQHAQIISSEDLSSPYTQIVLGEKHFVPRIQRDLLQTLSNLYDGLNFPLMGKEGGSIQLLTTNDYPIDYERAKQDDLYMQDLLKRKLNAASIFAKIHADNVIAKAIKNDALDEIAGKIDKRYYELFCLRQQRGYDGLTSEEEFEYNYWLALEKQIVLGERSNFMAYELYRQQYKLNAQTAVLVCGLAHTPCRDEYIPFSVQSMLHKLEINTIIAMSPVTWQSYERTKDLIEPFDFFTPVDELEINLYIPIQQQNNSLFYS